jgi:hypothetical protein
VEWYRKLMSSLLSWRWKMVSFLFFQLPVKNIMSLAFVLNCHLHAVTPFKLDIIVRWVDHRQNLSRADYSGYAFYHNRASADCLSRFDRSAVSVSSSFIMHGFSFYLNFIHRLFLKKIL